MCRFRDVRRLCLYRQFILCLDCKAPLRLGSRLVFGFMDSWCGVVCDCHMAALALPTVGTAGFSGFGGNRM
jgi:hypothetical protein